MDYVKKMKNAWGELNNGTYDNIKIVMLVAFLIIIIIYGFSYIYYIISGKLADECGKFTSTINSKILPVNRETALYQNPINFYFVKTSFNSCSLGSYVDDYVGICMLEYVIAQGVRWIDFQIFNLNDYAVIATTSVDENTFMKTTYNSVLFSDALDTIITKAFSSDGCNNFTDPLFLALRMQTTNVNVYNDIAKNLKKYIKYLVSGYSYGGNGADFASVVKLNEVLNKIVIVVRNDFNHTLENSYLYEYTNIILGSKHFLYNSYAFIWQGSDGGSKDQAIDDAAKYYAMYVFPTSENNVPTNSDPNVMISNGIQFLGMAYQIRDKNLALYENFFNNYGSAFVKKTNVPTTTTIDVDITLAQDPGTSLEKFTLMGGVASVSEVPVAPMEHTIQNPYGLNLSFGP